MPSCSSASPTFSSSPSCSWSSISGSSPGSSDCARRGRLAEPLLGLGRSCSFSNQQLPGSGVGGDGPGGSIGGCAGRLGIGLRRSRGPGSGTGGGGSGRAPAGGDQARAGSGGRGWFPSRMPVGYPRSAPGIAACSASPVGYDTAPPRARSGAARRPSRRAPASVRRARRSRLLAAGISAAGGARSGCGSSCRPGGRSRCRRCGRSRRSRRGRRRRRPRLRPPRAARAGPPSRGGSTCCEATCQRRELGLALG